MNGELHLLQSIRDSKCNYLAYCNTIAAQQHNSTAAQQHSSTTAQHHSITAAQQHNITTSWTPMAARKHGIIAARRHSGKRGIFERNVLTPALLRIAGESPDTKHACNMWFTRLHTQGYSAPHDAPSRKKSGIFASIFSCLVNLSRHSETRK